MELEAGRLRRRRHSPEFKAEAVAACRQPGASIAAAALRRSINANMLRRWVLEAERADAGLPKSPSALPAPTPAAKESFVAVPMLSKAADEPPIRIEVRRGATTVSVQWPSSSMPECALWLRELLR